MLRIFASPGCEKCKLIVGALTLLDLEFDYIDAMDQQYESLCDLNDVNALPHVQILDDKSGRVIWSAAKNVTLQNILTQLKYKNEFKQ